MDKGQIIIVGAGAAGIGAALECAAQGIPYTVLEAADRVGGRAYTAAAGLPHAWDHGCHWLHCADVNPLVAWADRLSAHYAKQRTLSDAFSVWDGGALLTPEGVRACDQAVKGAFEAIETSGRDVPIPEVLPDAGRWSPTVKLILALMAGDDAEDVSASGYADYRDTDNNWPVLSGYGALISAMAGGLNIRTACPVRAIHQRTDGATVVTDDGDLEAAGVIVTASTNVLARGSIHFSEGAAADLAHALDRVPCGAYEKVAFAMEATPEELADTRFLTVQQPGNDMATNFQVMRGDAPMMLCHMAGAKAHALVMAGPEAMTDYARAALVQVFGAGIEKRITGTATTNWTNDPLVLGSYSHARPGSADFRREMIARDTGRVAFAGEAFSLHWQATAHGAYDSGRSTAARMALKIS
ncbi:flavin monoamine oxidase family protein [Roseovarius nanhaiticus]|uniref:flavin monoamine oxidase family protein n=1 Tax=Roseovarius nanhaiticus TaxID=573024 RepID=UPI0024928640|nr:NAD(P)/FAD-dependent oxidoreductase [Roseovarius nanhaiticus]